MPIDIDLFRKEQGHDPQKIRDSEEKRFRDPGIVDQIIDYDVKWRKANFQKEQAQKRLGILQKDIKKRKQKSKGKDPCTEVIAEQQTLKAQVKDLKQVSDDLLANRTKLLWKVGNILEDDVPIGEDEEEDNLTVATWGDIPDIDVDNKTPGRLSHHQVLERIDGYDPKRGAKIAGHKGYFLKGPGCFLNFALAQYGLRFLAKKGYTPIYTPFFMQKKPMSETCQLSDFDDQLYKVTDGKPNSEPSFLIATSEQPISAYYRGEWLPTKDLPQMFAGYSSCFRKEAGAHGKDVWGIFRIHQFEKVEQFVVVEPGKSQEMHEVMIKNSEAFMQSLGLPYRVVSICSKELNDAASKKYDLEAWFPGYKTYRELVSCSNCTDFQSRGLNVTYGPKEKNGKRKFVHMLNGTLCATQRTLCCILENYQTDKGVRVPEVLQEYMPESYREFIPWAGKFKAKPKKPKPMCVELMLNNNGNKFLAELVETARRISTPGKGILAADESTGTIGKRFAMIDVQNNETNRRVYRELLFTTQGLEKYVSGVIMFEETTMHETQQGVNFIELLASKGIASGIKVDKGQAPIPGTDGETFTKGLDDLTDMCKRNYERGCRFAKWRSVIKFGDGKPSDKAIREVAYGLAQYASICQNNGLVPIVEPECTMDGTHPIQVCADVSQRVFAMTFQALKELGVVFEGMLLKPNMVTKGKQCGDKTSSEEVAKHTLTVLRRTVLPAVPGIFFLSGGQSEEEASLNLNAINAPKAGKQPWYLSFSYGRALQFSCLHAWQGKEENTLKAQKVLMMRAKANSEATFGKYKGTTDENAKKELYEKNYTY